MPTVEEELRREPDLFHKEEMADLAREQHEESLLKLERAGVEVKRELEAELRPEALVELTKDSESSDRAVEKLFGHMVEGPGQAKSVDDDDEAEPPTTPHVDVRQRARDQVDHTVREVDDVYADGVESDFQRDAKVVIGELDTHPASGDVTDEIQRKRRRRARVEDPLALPQGEPELSTPEAPATESKQSKG